MEEVGNLREERGSGSGLLGGHLVELSEHGRIHSARVVEEDSYDRLDVGELGRAEGGARVLERDEVGLAVVGWSEGGRGGC